MKNLNYIYYVDKLYEGMFSIPSYLKTIVEEKAKQDVFITICVVYNNQVMPLKWDEIEFLNVDKSSNTYNCMQYKNYTFLYINFVPTNMKLDDIDTILAPRIDHSLYNYMRKSKQILYDILLKVATIRKTKVVYPIKEDVLKIFKFSLNHVKVVILGQDPYPAGDHANGYAFGTKQASIPKSLFLIENSIKRRFPSTEKISDYSLENWAKQGVYLLNTALTVEEKNPNSHYELWKPFIDIVMAGLALRKNPIVFILLGTNAKKYKEMLSTTNHYVLEAEHPAAALHNDREWEDNNVFLECNRILNNLKEREIKW